MICNDNPAGTTARCQRLAGHPGEHDYNLMSAASDDRYQLVKDVRRLAGTLQTVNRHLLPYLELASDVVLPLVSKELPQAEAEQAYALVRLAIDDLRTIEGAFEDVWVPKMAPVGETAGMDATFPTFPVAENCAYCGGTLPQAHTFSDGTTAPCPARRA